jgi:hypothetical protein
MLPGTVLATHLKQTIFLSSVAGARTTQAWREFMIDANAISQDIDYKPKHLPVAAQEKS